MYDNDTSDDKKRMEYARAYVVLQKYENLFSVNDAIEAGTIFRDLYSSYKKKSNKGRLVMAYEEE